MDKRLQQLNVSRKRISKLCRKLHWLFLFCFAAYSLVVVILLILAIFPPEGYVGPESMISYVPIICNMLVGGYALLLIAQVLKGIGKGASPFSITLARKIKVIAAVLLIGVISGALVDPGTQVGLVNSFGTLAYNFEGDPNDIIHIYIDIKCLFMSVICFALSTVFRYGAILQSEADDLM